MGHIVRLEGQMEGKDSETSQEQLPWEAVKSQGRSEQKEEEAQQRCALQQKSCCHLAWPRPTPVQVSHWVTWAEVLEQDVQNAGPIVTRSQGGRLGELPGY